jgi:PEP-CTERM motif
VDVCTIGQKLFFLPISIYPWMAFSAFTLGEQIMKRGPALLLCGAVLIAAAPVWADTIPYIAISNDFDNIQVSASVARFSGVKLNAPLIARSRLPEAIPTTPNLAYSNPHPEFAEESPTIAISPQVTGGSDIQPNAPANAGFSAEQAAPSGELIGNFTANNTLEMSDSTRALALDKLLVSWSPLGDIGIHSATPDELDFEESSSSIAETGKESHNSGDGDSLGRTGEHRRRRANSILPVSVPEPGSRSLVLLGLAVVGLLGRRRATVRISEVPQISN